MRVEGAGGGRSEGAKGEKLADGRVFIIVSRERGEADWFRVRFGWLDRTG